MTTFNKQFKELVKVTLQERQQLNDQTDGDENIHVMHESAKAKITFKIITPLEKDTLRLTLNLETFYVILRT